MVTRVFWSTRRHALNGYWNFKTGDMVSEIFRHYFVPCHAEGIFFFYHCSCKQGQRCYENIVLVFSFLTAYNLLNMLFLFPLRLINPFFSLIINKWVWHAIIYLNSNFNSDFNWNSNSSVFIVRKSLKICLTFICFWDTERDRAQVGEGQRGGDTESKAGSRLWSVSTEPNLGLKPMNVRSWPEPKSDA